MYKCLRDVYFSVAPCLRIFTILQSPYIPIMCNNNKGFFVIFMNAVKYMCSKKLHLNAHACNELAKFTKICLAKFGHIR